jgi:hypothetical protein
VGYGGFILLLSAVGYGGFILLLSAVGYGGVAAKTTSG